MKENPREIILYLKNEKALSSAQIAKEIGCAPEYVNKIANGTRPTPNFMIVDRLRDFYQVKVSGDKK